MKSADQAKEVLKKINFVSMATVNEDGSPHNSPLLFLYDENFDYIYWGSHPESQHSRNILRIDKAFFVAFGSVDYTDGVYVKVAEGQIVKGENLVEALRVHNHFRTKMNKDALDIEYYSDDKPQRMWRAKVKQVWINDVERDEDGRRAKDFKIELNPAELTLLWD